MKSTIKEQDPKATTDILVEDGLQKELSASHVTETRGETASAATVAVAVLSDDDKEITEEDPRLNHFLKNYQQFSAEDKARCSWQEIRERLLANNGHYLELASAMNKGGILFGVDRQGNPLIADDGWDDEMIMQDVDYETAEQFVYFKYDLNKEDYTDELSGYEMFPRGTIAEAYSKEIAEDERKDVLDSNFIVPRSFEVLAFERFTGRSFVSSLGDEDGPSHRVWLESRNLIFSHFCYSRYEDGRSYTRATCGSRSSASKEDCLHCNVRRLLRILKKS